MDWSESFALNVVLRPVILTLDNPQKRNFMRGWFFKKTFLQLESFLWLFWVMNLWVSKLFLNIFKHIIIKNYFKRYLSIKLPLFYLKYWTQVMYLKSFFLLKLLLTHLSCFAVKIMYHDVQQFSCLIMTRIVFSFPTSIKNMLNFSFYLPLALNFRN